MQEAAGQTPDLGARGKLGCVASNEQDFDVSESSKGEAEGGEIISGGDEAGSSKRFGYFGEGAEISTRGARAPRNHPAKAGIPVICSPRMSRWTSCVPS